MKASRRCTAHSTRTGLRCKRAAILGGTVCRTHGGAAPQVRDAARLRLAALVDPAIDALSRAIRAKGAGVRGSSVTAARDVLDRHYGKPTQAVELAQPEPTRVVHEVVIVKRKQTDA